MHYFKGKNVLVYGMGKSGQAASKLLHQNDACVSIYDEKTDFESYFCFDKYPFSKNYEELFFNRFYIFHFDKFIILFCGRRSSKTY